MDKPYKILYLPIAQNDVEEILSYIAIDSPKESIKMIDKLEQGIAKLGVFPFLGVIPKDERLKKQEYRMLLIENYIVFYVVKEDIIEIRRILHGKRNYGFLF